MADVSLLPTQSGLGQTRETLRPMLGWTYGAQVDIRDVSEPNLEGMVAINLEEDASRGVENSHGLKIFKKKIVNTESDINKTNLEQGLKSQKETAASSIENAYGGMIIFKSDYEQALDTCEIGATVMAAVGRKMAAGATARNDYVTQQAVLATTRVNVCTQKLALLKAQLEYRRSVDGLAFVPQDVSIWETEQSRAKHRKWQDETRWDRNEKPQ